MKWIILLFLLAVLAAIFITRYKKQLNGAILLWKTLQNPAEKQIRNSENLREVPLVRCVDCGTWIPQSNALRRDSKSFSCSQNCPAKTVSVE